MTEEIPNIIAESVKLNSGASQMLGMTVLGSGHSFPLWGREFRSVVSCDVLLYSQIPSVCLRM